MSDSSKKKYADNYRKPPKAFQFQKGKSGNPKGRPKMKRVDFDPGKILQAIDNEELVVIIDGKRKTQSNLEMYFRQLFTRSINGDIASARLIANMSPTFFRPEEEGPSDIRFVVMPDEFWDPEKSNRRNDELTERSGNPRGRTRKISQTVSPRYSFRKVARSGVPIEVNERTTMKMEYLQISFRQIYTAVAQIKTPAAARLLYQPRMQRSPVRVARQSSHLLHCRGRANLQQVGIRVVRQSTVICGARCRRRQGARQNGQRRRVVIERSFSRPLTLLHDRVARLTAISRSAPTDISA